MFERVFGNPLGVDITAVAGALGVPAVVVDTVPALQDALEDALGLGGVRIVVARTVDRAQEAEILTEVQRAVSSALESG